MTAPNRCPRCQETRQWKEAATPLTGIPLGRNVRLAAPRGLLTVFIKVKYRCGSCGYEKKYSKW